MEIAFPGIDTVSVVTCHYLTIIIVDCFNREGKVVRINSKGPSICVEEM